MTRAGTVAQPQDLIDVSALGGAILAEGTAVVTGAQWRGRAALRCSMSSWATTPADVERTLAAIRSLAAVAPMEDAARP